MDRLHSVAKRIYRSLKIYRQLAQEVADTVAVTQHPHKAPKSGAEKQRSKQYVYISKCEV